MARSRSASHAGDSDIRLILKYLAKPDAHQIVENLQHQINQHQTSETDRPEWEWLVRDLEDAKCSLAREDIHAACSAFYQVGIIAATFMYDNTEKQNILFELAMEALARRWPLDERNSYKKVVKEFAQQIAKRNWEAETDRNIRTGEMAQIVWAELVDEKIPADTRKKIMKALPNSADGLRKWLSPIAPKGAKKPGRPRKN